MDKRQQIIESVEREFVESGRMPSADDQALGAKVDPEAEHAFWDEIEARLAAAGLEV
jgi:hypothetical protein